MAGLQPRYSKEEFARRGDQIFECDIAPHLGDEDPTKFIVIDIESGAYEIDEDELAASDRLLARKPDAQMSLRRVGSRYARKMRYIGTAIARQGFSPLKKKVRYA